MITQINFKGSFVTNCNSASAIVDGTIFLRAESSGLLSWDGDLKLKSVEGNIPILPQGRLTLEDGRSGDILITQNNIGTGYEDNRVSFKGTGPLA